MFPTTMTTVIPSAAPSSRYRKTSCRWSSPSRAQMWDADQHTARNERFQVFFMPDAHVCEFEKCGEAQADAGTEAQPDET